MLKEYKTGFLIGAVYIGAIIGAGFATGQELVRYFVRFGIWGLTAIPLCGLIFAISGYKAVYFMHLKGCRDYREFLHLVMGKKLGTVAEVISFLFIIALYSSMLAASGALLHQLFNISRLWGSLFTCIFCSLLVFGGVNSLGLLNFILCPLLVCGSVLMGLWLYFGSVDAFASYIRIDNNILGSSVVYVAYNVISSVSLLCAVSKKVKSLKDAVTGGILGGLTLGITGLCLALPLYKYFSVAENAELPILSLIALSDKSFILKPCYTLLLSAAILTTAAGNCYSAVECLCPARSWERFVWVIVVSSSALLLSLMGFQVIVGRLYYFFGCLGLLELAMIIALKTEK